jgi:hypothetical protein
MDEKETFGSYFGGVAILEMNLKKQIFLTHI